MKLTGSNLNMFTSSRKGQVNGLMFGKKQDLDYKEYRSTGGNFPILRISTPTNK
jgi:uncharacterized protein (UPF0303 family)